jgi:hypothetical protein
MGAERFGQLGFDPDQQARALENAVEVRLSSAVSDPELMLEREGWVEATDPGDLQCRF